jgi:signal transduction histidine kinase
VVGAERGVLDILRIEDIRPLLRGAVRAGVVEALLLLADGVPVCSEAAPAAAAGELRKICSPLRLEGEPVGTLVVRGVATDLSLDGIAAMLASAIDVVLANNLKRMLTTEMHTTVVTQTYDELLVKNQELSASEARYRVLSENLEQLVQQRTAELELAHAKLLQQEKMASVGQLAAGVAHEINNPLGFITSNLVTLQKYVDRFLTMIDWYDAGLAAGATRERLRDGAASKQQELKLALVRADVADLLNQSIAGAQRVTRIVADLKGYSHVDETSSRDFDLNSELERALSVLTHQLPADVQIERQLIAIPRVQGNGALFCQVLTNLIQNACQARSQGLRLSFASRLRDGMVELTVTDNGPGIPLATRDRVFEPFFTTKAVGSGTGMGLTVVYDIITTAGGSISITDSQSGGACFVLQLPLSDPERG